MVKTKKKQEGKDVFEYNVFGSPQQKIGNFANQNKKMYNEIALKIDKERLS